MSQDEMKKQAAQAALAYVEGGTIGVGTGSTVNHFIEALATLKGRIDGVVSSSEVSTQLLKGHGIPVCDLNAVGELALYIDGADEANRGAPAYQGRGRRAHPGEDRRRGQQALRVHRRREQAG